MEKMKLDSSSQASRFWGSGQRRLSARSRESRQVSAEEEEKEEEEIVAKALDGQRYPLPLSECMRV